MLNRVFNAFLKGFGIILGAELAHKVVDTVKNPVKRAKIKEKFKKIKTTITE